MYDYIKQLRWAKLKVGIVITAALAIAFLAVMFSGNIERIFVPRSTIYATFSDVKGLREGSPVWFSGVEIGSVKKMRFTPERTIVVEMSIRTTTLSYLKKDSLADVLTLGLLGDKYIEITPGGKGSPGLAPGDTITGTSHAEIQDIVETGQKSIASLQAFITTLENVLVKIEKGEGTLSKFIKDPALYDNLRDATGELSALITKLKNSKGTVSRLLEEDDLYVDIAASAKDVRQFADRLRTSDGTLNRLIEDERLYENFNEVSKRLNRILERIDRGEGFAGSLLKDKELTGELKTTLKEMSTLMKDIREHPKKYFKFSLF
jgi:phospholipid/cholesterol/gamma-HCH transport system substrate-binding protein